MTQNITDLKVKILPVLKKYGVKKAGLFGSVAFGKQNDKSDVDILVELDDDKSYFDFLDLHFSLENAIGKSVDLVEYDQIKPLIKNQVLNQEVRLYER